MEKLLQEIHAFFPDFNMSIYDLKNPTVTFVRDFYSRVLIELGVDSDNVRKPQIDQLEYAQDMDLLPILNLITAINTAFPFVHINLFDMLQPSPKRNAILMSKVMNFMEFCEARVAANNQEIIRYQEAKEFENKLLEVREMKAKELNDLACELESCHQETKDLKIKIDLLENGSYENKKNNSNLKEVVQMLEEKIAVWDKKIESLKCEINLINSEIDNLKSQIVLNPDEEKRELEAKIRIKDGVSEKKSELENKVKEYKETKEKMQIQQELIEKRVLPIINDLEVLRISQEMEVSAQKTKKELEELHRRKEKSVKDLEEIRKNIEIEENNLKIQLTELEKEEELHRQTLMDKKNEYTSKSKEYRKQHNSLQEELDLVNKIILNLENEYKELRSKFAIVAQAMQSQLMEITKGKYNQDY